MLIFSPIVIFSILPMFSGKKPRKLSSKTMHGWQTNSRLSCQVVADVALAVNSIKMTNHANLALFRTSHCQHLQSILTYIKRFLFFSSTWYFIHRHFIYPFTAWHRCPQLWQLLLAASTFVDNCSVASSSVEKLQSADSACTELLLNISTR